MFLILLLISVVINIILITYSYRNFNLLKSYENIIIDFQEKIETAYGQLENLNHKEYFQEHDSVGIAFKTIFRIFYDLNNFLEK